MRIPGSRTFLCSRIEAGVISTRSSSPMYFCFDFAYTIPATTGCCDRINLVGKRPRGAVPLFVSDTRSLRWLRRVVLGVVAVVVLQQVAVRVLRRVAPPGPMPPRLAPVLTTPLRLRLFGTPERVVDRAGVAPGMRVLEVGPGPGVYTAALARRVVLAGEDGGLTCLEIQSEMIAMLHERLRAAGVRNVEILQGDGRLMPLPDGRFDLVFLVDVVGEMPDKPAFFRECARMLKPGGTLAVTEQIIDPDYHLPNTIRMFAADAGLREEVRVGSPWWTYTARYRK